MQLVEADLLHGCLALLGEQLLLQFSNFLLEAAPFVEDLHEAAHLLERLLHTLEDLVGDLLTL